jgi:hypothetical protein
MVIRKLLILTVIALLVAPATAIAANPGKGQNASASEAGQGQSLSNPARVCTNLRISLTASIFGQQYGTFGKCVSQNTKAQLQTTSSAEEACRAEQSDPNFSASHDGKTFDAYYGKNENDHNAFGKCVSSKAKAKWDARIAAVKNAAKACWNERKGDVAAFKSHWKTFGACVSAKAKV